MTQRGDWLWDGSGAADPEIARLQALLAPLAHDGRALPQDLLPAQRPPRRGRWPWLLAAAAALLCVGGAAWLLRDAPLAEGDSARTFVAGTTPLRIELGPLAELTLQPGGELRFDHWRADQALFTLRRGALTARVAPPPRVPAGFFQVETALGRVVDQGCRYELSLDAEGRAHVAVSEGAVTFVFPQRTVFVPAGAATTVAPAAGPATPLFADCTDELRKATHLYDELAAGSLTRKGGGAEMRHKGLEMVAQHCEKPRDSLVLWHLLHDPDPLLREIAEQHLLRLTGPPIEASGKVKDEHWEPEVWLPFLRRAAWR